MDRPLGPTASFGQVSADDGMTEYAADDCKQYPKTEAEERAREEAGYHHHLASGSVGFQRRLGFRDDPDIGLRQALVFCRLARAFHQGLVDIAGGGSLSLEFVEFDELA